MKKYPNLEKIETTNGEFGVCVEISEFIRFLQAEGGGIEHPKYETLDKLFAAYILFSRRSLLNHLLNEKKISRAAYKKMLDLNLKTAEDL